MVGNSKYYTQCVKTILQKYIFPHFCMGVMQEMSVLNGSAVLPFGLTDDTGTGEISA